MLLTILWGILATSGLYYGVEWISKSNPAMYASLQNFVQKYIIRRSGILVKVQKMLDGKRFIG